MVPTLELLRVRFPLHDDSKLGSYKSNQPIDIDPPNTILVHNSLITTILHLTHTKAVRSRDKCLEKGEHLQQITSIRLRSPGHLREI
jgi:hypothetical protein